MTNNRFLAFTKKYGWIVVEPAQPGWGDGYTTIPGKYGIAASEILRREELPHNPEPA